MQRTPVVHSLTMSASATVALVLLFLPKVHIMIFKPERNNRSAFTTTRDVRCHIGRAAGLSQQHSFSTSAESFDRSPPAPSSLRSGLYLSNFIRGVEVLAIEVDDRANA